MEWLDTAVAWLRDFFNQPVPIIGCSVLALGTFVATVIGKTSIGKKALIEFRSGLSDISSRVSDVSVKAKDSLYKAKLEAEELKKELEAELYNVQKKCERQDELILSIAKEIHNSKVKALIEDYIQGGTEDGKDAEPTEEIL